jgi:hypothetical protein
MQKRMIAPVVAALIVLLGMGSLFIANTSLTTAVHSDGRTIDVLAANNDALRAQVKSLGETPVAPPAATVTSSPPTDGRDGRDGQDARPATPSELLAQVYAYCATVSCDGQPGRDGVTVTGQPGTAGVNGADGAPGASGVKGDPGAAGPSGTPGEPPSSWTYTDALGIQNTCTRTDPFDATVPTYTCAPTPEGATP